MWTSIIILLFFSAESSKSVSFNNNNAELRLSDTSPCKTEIDSLIKKLIYITADVLPSNEGGNAALMKELEKRITLENISIPENFDSNIIIGFIVDTDGSLNGERIIKDGTNKVAQQMLSIAKTFKWIPALCDGKKVAMLYTLSMIIDIAGERS